MRSAIRMRRQAYEHSEYTHPIWIRCGEALSVWSHHLPQFVERTFAAVEVERHAFGPKSFHVAYKIGDSVVIIEAGDLPPDVSPWVGAIYVYVEDVDAVYDRALKLGAKAVARPEDKPYQERSAGFQDAGGNTWWIATYNGSR